MSPAPRVRCPQHIHGSVQGPVLSVYPNYHIPGGVRYMSDRLCDPVGNCNEVNGLSSYEYSHNLTLTGWSEGSRHDHLSVCRRREVVIFPRAKVGGFMVNYKLPFSLEPF
jgi:hypothetical protein